MSLCKNPYVKLEKLPDYFIEFESCSDSSVEELPARKTNQRPTFLKKEEIKERKSRFAKTEMETERIPRLAKQKVKKSSLIEVSEDEKSIEELDDSDAKDSDMKNSDYEEEDKPKMKESPENSDSDSPDEEHSDSDVNPNYPAKRTNQRPTFLKREEVKERRSRFAKTEMETERLPRLAKRKVKQSSLIDVSEDEKSVEELDDSDAKNSDMKDSDYEEEDEPKMKESPEISDSDSPEEEDSDDGEFNPNYFKGKKRKATSKSKKAKEKQKKKVKRKELTEYEKLVLKNKDDKMAFLKSLKINEVKDSFSDAVKSFRLKVKPKRIIVPKPPVVPRQKIARSSKVKMSLSEDAIDARNRSKAKAELLEMENQKTKTVADLPSRIQLKSVLDVDQSYELFLDDFRGLHQGCTAPIENYESRFNDMALLTSCVKVFPYTEVTALDIHPMQEKTIMAVGAENGNIYLWNMADQEPYSFKLHSKSISQLKFCPENPHLIMCCSKDGLLRKGDLISNTYNKVNDDKDCMYFDFLSPDTYLAAHHDGCASVIDLRVSRKKRITHQCNEYMLRTVSLHPVNKNEFVTPTNSGCVRLWDLRNLQKKPVKEVKHVNKTKCLISAIYSPATGKSVVTSSVDAQICVSDPAIWMPMGTYGSFRIKCPTASKTFLATWQPRTDNILAMGSPDYPKGISIYNRKDKIFQYGQLRQQIGCCTFHPSLPIIAGIGGNKIFPFADKSLKLEEEVEITTGSSSEIGDNEVFPLADKSPKIEDPVEIT